MHNKHEGYRGKFLRQGRARYLQDNFGRRNFFNFSTSVDRRLRRSGSFDTSVASVEGLLNKRIHQTEELVFSSFEVPPSTNTQAVQSKLIISLFCAAYFTR